MKQTSLRILDTHVCLIHGRSCVHSTRILEYFQSSVLKFKQHVKLIFSGFSHTKILRLTVKSWMRFSAQSSQMSKFVHYSTPTTYFISYFSWRLQLMIPWIVKFPTRWSVYLHTHIVWSWDEKYFDKFKYFSFNLIWIAAWFIFFIPYKKTKIKYLNTDCMFAFLRSATYMYMAFIYFHR